MCRFDAKQVSPHTLSLVICVSPQIWRPVICVSPTPLPSKRINSKHPSDAKSLWPEKIAFWGFTCPLIDNWSLDTPLEHETVKSCYSIRIFSRCLPTPALLSSLDSLPRLRSLLQTKMVGVRYEHASIENSTKKKITKNKGLWTYYTGHVIAEGSILTQLIATAGWYFRFFVHFSEPRYNVGEHFILGLSEC